jgi:CMP-N-acetylneuraminic acid synthetase
MSLLALIPARGGSRGIARKNIRPFLGKPLLAWTIEAANASGLFERIVVSTDDEEIAQAARSAGANVPFLRPAELATDDAPTVVAVQHALRWLADHDRWTPEAVMVLEPTAPARRAFHIQEAAALLQRPGVDSVASVSEVPHHFTASKLLQLRPDGTMAGLNGTPIARMTHRRQELEKTYAFNGLIFACRAALVMQDPPTLWGERVIGYVVDRKYGVDLDEPDDWGWGEMRLRKILEEEGQRAQALAGGPAR